MNSLVSLFNGILTLTAFPQNQRNTHVNVDQVKYCPLTTTSVL